MYQWAKGKFDEPSYWYTTADTRNQKSIQLKFKPAQSGQKQEGFKLNCKHQLLVNADDVSIFVVSIRNVRRNTGDLRVASKEISLEVNADKSKHVVVSRG
jgi:hypothetical protein